MNAYTEAGGRPADGYFSFCSTFEAFSNDGRQRSSLIWPYLNLLQMGDSSGLQLRFRSRRFWSDREAAQGPLAVFDSARSVVPGARRCRSQRDTVVYPASAGNGANDEPCRETATPPMGLKDAEPPPLGHRMLDWLRVHADK